MSREGTWGAAALALTVLALAGCGAAVSPPRLVTIDKTGSATGSDALCRHDVVAWARKLYGGVEGERGELRVAVFNVESASAPRFDTRVAFRVDAHDSSSPKRIDDAIAREFDELDARIADRLASTLAGGPTDIVATFAGLGEAARSVGAKSVYVCSDGVDGRIQRQMTPAHARQVVEGLEADALPDLDGIEVTFDTSSAEGRAGLGAVQLAAIREFVARLIQRSGGTLVAYGSGAGT